MPNSTAMNNSGQGRPRDSSTATTAIQPRPALMFSTKRWTLAIESWAPARPQSVRRSTAPRIVPGEDRRRRPQRRGSHGGPQQASRWRTGTGRRRRAGAQVEQDRLPRLSRSPSRHTFEPRSAIGCRSPGAPGHNAPATPKIPRRNVDMPRSKQIDGDRNDDGIATPARVELGKQKKKGHAGGKRRPTRRHRRRPKGSRRRPRRRSLRSSLPSAILKTPGRAHRRRRERGEQDRRHEARGGSKERGVDAGQDPSSEARCRFCDESSAPDTRLATEQNDHRLHHQRDLLRGAGRALHPRCAGLDRGEEESRGGNRQGVVRPAAPSE